MKKKILYIAAIAICLSIITGGTLAYFTAEDTARNVITSGGIDVTVIEQQLVHGVLQPYPAEPVQVMPGTTVSKIASARNNEQTAWIRMGYEIVVYTASGQLLDLSQQELAKAIVINHNPENWTAADGWWYYNTPVKTGETTAPLFESVDFSGPGMGNEYQNCTMEIIVTAQAVQYANNGKTVMEAAGWPE